MNIFYIIIPIMIIGVSFGAYVIYYDISIDAESYSKTRTCKELKFFLDNDGRKIIHNIFTNSVKKIYDARDCELEAKK